MTSYQITAGLIGLAMAVMATWPSLSPKSCHHARITAKDTDS
ncbi:MULTISPECIES: hypothetical protein [unclassified Streptomyces]|nr:MULTISPECIES: hypothetical protein [unclassified Streptomyces]